MTADAPPRIRPGLVWAIFLLHLFGFVSFSGLLLLRAVPWLPVNVALTDRLGMITPLDWCVAWGASLLGMAGATLLFFLRPSALWVFVASTLAWVVVAVRLVTLRQAPESLTPIGGLGMLTLCMTLMTSVAIIVYILALDRRGVLARSKETE